jgi:predicted ArsR family transcriptional regulator
MTPTQEQIVVHLLGNPMTVAQLAAATGRPGNSVRAAIRHLVEQGSVVAKGTVRATGGKAGLRATVWALRSPA